MKKIIKSLKKNYKKALCIGVSAVMVLALIFAGTMAFGEKEALADEEKNAVNEAASEISDALLQTNGSVQLGDGNTTYVIQDATGAPSKVIVPCDGDFEEMDLATYKQPIDVKISYTLDGKEMTAEEIAGRSGRVTVRFDYTNNEKKTVEIQGKNEDLFVPYIAVSGLILDDENFSNVEITHGKAVDDGNRTIVGGIALPGMKYNIDPNAGMDEIQKIPEYIEVSADATNFSLAMTLTVIAPLNLDEIDIDSFDGLSGLGDDMDALVDAVDAIENGADDLSDAAKKIATGADSIYDGAKTLDSGLGTLSDNSDSLRTGAKTVFNTMLSTVQTQLEGAGLPVGELTISNYADKLNYIIELSGGSETVIAAKKSLDSYNEFYLGLKSYTEGVDSAADGAGTLKTGAKTLSDGAGKLKDGAKDLASGVKKFNDEGISKLKDLFGDDISNALARLSKVIEIGKETSSAKYIMRSAKVE